jgi:putative transposase
VVRASAYRDAVRPDSSVELRQRILALAQRHKRCSAGMIQQAGWLVNYKRMERLYLEVKLQVRRRKRTKVTVTERQPLARPTTPTGLVDRLRV